MPKSMLEIAKRVDEFFAGHSPVHLATKRLSAALREMGISYVVTNDMAVNHHGHHHATERLAIVIRRVDLVRFKEQHLGRGWVDKFEGSKNCRDAVAGVNIDALTVGDYPGDGKPKPIAFPPPEQESETGEDGIPYVSLKTLLELKLASGMTAPHRPRDLDDAIQLIRANHLASDYADTLDPYVAGKFRELWQAAQVVDDY